MTETTKPVLTRAQKYAARIAVLVSRISKDQAELAEVQLEADTASKLANVGVGTVIVARLGRAGSAAVEAVEAQPERLAEDGITILPAVAAVAAKAATAGTLKQVNATVLGVKEEESGSLRYKIAFGEGFDADTVIIQASQIIEVLDGAATAEPELPSAAVDALYAAEGVNYQ